MPTLTDHINRLLPQTQCRECGYAGCLPYAQALAEEHADIHLCKPGGEAVLHDLSRLLHRPVEHAAPPHQNVVAHIDEAVCIGCTACIRACPVDAIMGASKLMHTVLADECTGCGLCVPPCPVDCIDLLPSAHAHLPAAHDLADDQSSERFAAAAHAKARYDNRQARQAREAAERKRQHAERAAQIKADTQKTDAQKTNVQAALNPAALIAQAMARAQAQQNQRIVPSNHEEFRREQVRQAQEKATYRRHMHDAQHGSGEQKAAAIAWLQRHKAEQEAQNESKSI